MELLSEDFHEWMTDNLPIIGWTIFVGLMITSCVFCYKYIKKMLANDKEDDETSESINEEIEEVKAPLLTNKRNHGKSPSKQIGVVKGVINKQVLTSIRRRPLEDLSQSNSLEMDDEEMNSDILNEDRDDEPIRPPEPALALEDDKDYVRTSERLHSIPTTIREVEDEDEDNSACSSPSASTNMITQLGTLHGKLATAQLRARTRQIHSDMSDEEKLSEAQVKAKQMESIMALMMQNQEKFGMSTEEEIKEQMNMYNFG